MVNLDREWKIAVFSVVIGVMLGGAASYLVTDYFRQKDLDDQQNNIARALYIDISKIDKNLEAYYENNQKIIANNKINIRSKDILMIDPTPYYNDKGLYFVFAEDISRFDNETAYNLYNYYSDIMQLENKRVFADSIRKKYSSGENYSEYDLLLAHLYSEEIYDTTPRIIKDGKRIETKLKEYLQ